MFDGFWRHVCSSDWPVKLLWENIKANVIQITDETNHEAFVHYEHASIKKDFHTNAETQMSDK